VGTTGRPAARCSCSLLSLQLVERVSDMGITGLETVYPGSLGMTTRPGILAAALSPRVTPPALSTFPTAADTVQAEDYVASAAQPSQVNFRRALESVT